MALCVCVSCTLVFACVGQRKRIFECGYWSSPAYREQQHLLSQPDKESIMEAIHLPGEGLQKK